MKKDNNLELVDPKSVHVNENVITSGVTVKHEEIISNLTEEDVKYINIRKQIELDTIQKYDKVSITPRKECWYIIDSKWLNQWTKYVLHKSTINDTNCSTDKNSKNDVDNELDDEVSPPGLLTTEDLHDENGELLLNLQPNLDYRGVRPLIYYIFVELYGRKEITKRNPELTRYQCDIYKIPVTTVDMLKIRYVWHVSICTKIYEVMC